MTISVFLSTVSDEFRAYRDQLVHDLTRQNVAVKVYEDFKDPGGDTLDKLDVYIAQCDAVVHLVGDMCGTLADESQQRALIAKYPDLSQSLWPLREALAEGIRLPYTQWEAWLALYHGKLLMIAKAAQAAPRGPRYAATDASRAGQAAHLARLKAFHRYPGGEFTSPDELAKQILSSAILDLMVEDYGRKAAQESEVAEGFIQEMAKRVAGDKSLDLDGMKQAVRNAIELYEKEIAGRPVKTNLDDIVSRALVRAKEQSERGQSSLARATLRRAAEEMRREEAERRERYVANVTALYHRERDIALSANDPKAADDAKAKLESALRAGDGDQEHMLQSEPALNASPQKVSNAVESVLRSPDRKSLKVFVSYRREDSAGIAGRIYDRLADRLGRQRVFFDVDNIPPGVDFVRLLSEQVSDCDFFVAIIGKRWLTTTGERNLARLEDARDFVRIEIETALRLGIPIIPVLVDGAAMPAPESLPDSLRPLAYRQGVEISHSRFSSDIRRLIGAVRRPAGQQTDTLSTRPNLQADH
jgi:TIR domain/Domain of unknown function (DUF4062)